MAPSADWRTRAACRRVRYEMVPDADRVRTAKAVCRSCPVRIRCLLAAEKLRAECGSDAALGVWGGLTERERDTMYGMGRLPEPCVRCGLECVPINMATSECSACNPKAWVLYEDYRMMIELRLKEGRSYAEIAEDLRLNLDAVKSACTRWKLKSGKRSQTRTRTDVLPCGTLAAKYRHHRKEKKTGNPADGFRNCPECRLVPWSRGQSKVAA
jgi:hypothetical protein